MTERNNNNLKRDVTVIPAFGRDYKSAEAAVADWLAGRDFQISDVSWGADSGGYTSVRDSARFGAVKIRYDGWRRVAVVPETL